MTATGIWGPQSKRAALSITFDNFGEAAEMAFGVLHDGAETGRHYTATSVLPRLLELVGGLEVTYFIEGVNAEIYPDQLQRIQAAGHEIGLHAWKHEGWNHLELSVQELLLHRSVTAMKSIGVSPVGFRPPAGEVSADGLSLLRRMGFAYCSPVGARASRVEGEQVILPFQWRHVDAYMLEPELAAFRAAHGAPEAAIGLDWWREVLADAVASAAERGEHRTLIFHPYLFGRDAAQWDVLARFISDVRANQDLWLAPMAQVAQWMTRHAPKNADGAKVF